MRRIWLARLSFLVGSAARLGTWRGNSPLGALAHGLSEDYLANVATETLLMRAQRQIV